MLLQRGTLLKRAESKLVFRSLCPLTQRCTILGIDPEEIRRSKAEIYIQGRPVHHCHSPHLGSESENTTCLDTRGFTSKMVLRSRRERVGKEEGKSHIMRQTLWGTGALLHPRTGHWCIYPQFCPPLVEGCLEQGSQLSLIYFQAPLASGKLHAGLS